MRGDVLVDPRPVVVGVHVRASDRVMGDAASVDAPALPHGRMAGPAELEAGAENGRERVVETEVMARRVETPDLGSGGTALDVELDSCSLRSDHEGEHPRGDPAARRVGRGDRVVRQRVSHRNASHQPPGGRIEDLALENRPAESIGCNDAGRHQRSEIASPERVRRDRVSEPRLWSGTHRQPVVVVGEVGLVLDDRPADERSEIVPPRLALPSEETAGIEKVIL